MENDIMSILAESPFTDDPINWIKWGFVFAVMIFSYIILFKISNKISYKLDIERKVEKAKARGHVLQGELEESWVSSTRNKKRGYIRYYSGRYKYCFKGETRHHRVRFTAGRRPPVVVTLYYVDSPGKLFTPEQRKDYTFEAILNLVFTFTPWLIAALFILLLGLVKI